RQAQAVCVSGVLRIDRELSAPLHGKPDEHRARDAKQRDAAQRRDPTPSWIVRLFLRHNAMPLSGRGGVRATPDLKQSIPPPRSAPMAGYLPGSFRNGGYFVRRNLIRTRHDN